MTTKRTISMLVAGVILLVALGLGEAAIINVGGACSLINAITAANNDAATGSCLAGNGADTIVLPGGSTHTLTSVNNTFIGPSGLPVIRSVVTVDGHGAVISRATSAPSFRMFVVDSTGNLTLNEVILRGGRITGDGGAVYNFFGSITIRNSTLTGNTASAGGAVFNGSGTVLIDNSTISGNSTTFFGGGIQNHKILTISNSTITDNAAVQQGGGVANYGGSLTLARSLISGNAAPSGPEVFYLASNTGSVSVNAYNLFGFNGNTGVSGFSPGPADIVPTVSLGAILESALTTNDSSTLTHALPAGSPAMNAIIFTEPACKKSSKDQRGIVRPQGPGCDIGAFEFRGSACMVPGGARPIPEVIRGFPPCGGQSGPQGPLSPQWGRFSPRQVLEATSGEKLELECSPGFLFADSYELFYTSPAGQRHRAGKCPFRGGCNTAYFFHAGNNIDRDKPDCFIGTIWVSKDYGGNDKPNPWTLALEPFDNYLDWAISVYDANTNYLAKINKKFEYGIPPPLSCKDPRDPRGPLVQAEYIDPPLGPETEVFFDAVQDALETLPPGEPMEEEPLSACDFDMDKDCDAEDSAFFQSTLGTCQGDDNYYPIADFDRNGCVDTNDQQFFLNPDTDRDGVVDAEDNCLTVANADQADSNNDGIGDACWPGCGNGKAETGEQCDDGNTTSGDGCSATCQNEVPVYSFTGFFPPIDNNGVLNQAKAGQTIPVKWRLLDASGAPVSDPASFVNITSAQVSCSTLSAGTDEVEEYTAGSSSLQYLGEGNWQFNWKTPKNYAGQCRIMRLNLADETGNPSTRTANFQFR